MSKNKNNSKVENPGVIDELLDDLSLQAELETEITDEDSLVAVPFTQRVKRLFTNENNERTAFLQALRHPFRSQKMRHGSMSVLLTAVFMIIVVIVNVISIALVEKYPLLNIDLTDKSIYSLSDATISILESLDDDIAIIILASENNCTSPDITIDPYGHIPEAHELILRYAGYSDHISIDHVDLTRTPGILNEEFLSGYLDLLGDYSIIVLNQNNGKVSITSFYDMLPSLTADYYYDSTDASYDVSSSYAETELTSAIRSVIIERDTLPEVAYVDDLGGDSACAFFLSSLEQNNYTLTQISSSQDIPSTAEILVLPAPTVDLSEWFARKIELWLYNDGAYGHTLILFSTPIAPDLPELDALLNNWGLDVTSEMVFESNSSYVIAGASTDSYFKARYDDATYTGDLSERGIETAVIMPCRINLLYQSQDNKVTKSILTSSSGGYACISADEYDSVKGSASLKGAHTIMASSTWYGTDLNGNTLRSDIIVAPSTIYQSDLYSSNTYGNFSLMMTVCDERTGMGNMLVDIQAKYLTEIDFSVDDSSLSAIRIIFRVCLPILLLAAGVVVYIRRRYL